MTRWVSLVAGVALIVLAFGAASRVADTREGLVAEIITLLAGGAGISLATYGLVARRRSAPASPSTPTARPAVLGLARAGTSRDLALGGGGIVLAAILLTGLALTGGVLMAGLGLVLLLPMLAGSVYLCWRSLRSSS